MDLFLYLFSSILSVMNPFGTVPIYVELSRNFTSEERNWIALRTCLNILVILISSFFFGQYLLSFFGITITSLRLAGGLVICTSGFALLTGTFNKHKGMKRESVKDDLKTRKDFTLTPLALPMLAGPGTISLLIGFKENLKTTKEIMILALAIFAISTSVFLILISSKFIVHKMGGSGLNALSRIIGFVVIAIGIEMISKSIFEFGKTFYHSIH